MLGNAIGSFFDLLGALWNGFWNVIRKFLTVIVFTVLGGVLLATIGKIAGASDPDAWLMCKAGAFVGCLISGIRMLINEVAVPLVHEQNRRARMQARRELELKIAKSRAAANQESVSNRLKHLN